jgi:hypothetical protein
MYGFVVQLQLALLTLKILIANNRLSESFQPPYERQESAGKISQERTTHIVRIVNAERSSAFAMAKARGSLALDRLNFFRLEAPHVFHPICATRAVQKASEDYSDRGAALNAASCLAFSMVCRAPVCLARKSGPAPNYFNNRFCLH